MLKRLIVIFFLLFLTFTKTVNAQEEFQTDINVVYDVNDKGVTTVTHNITIENRFSNLYATNYSIFLEGIEPLNSRVVESGKNHELKVNKKDATISISINFEDALVGKQNKREFSIIYEENTIASRTGEVWEISIPRLVNENSYDTYRTELLVPSSFGNAAYISPEPNFTTQSSSGKTSITFVKKDLVNAGVVAAFGKFQVFEFDLIYHLQNPLPKAGVTQIAIPPDTAFQKVIYESITPKPQSVSVDIDGNWLATYKLKPRERVDIKVSGSVQIFAIERPFLMPTQQSLEVNLKQTDFWQVENPQIQSLATQLVTPKAIYDYIVDNFSYDTSRVRPNVKRLGALEAINSPSAAICMEFTDSFVAIARAAGIPAREVNGFAYSEDPTIQPLSLVADVLHAWPEYWDPSRGVWVPIDPTWGNTTGGVDFFSKLDLRHFTFVVHGDNSTEPFPPGSYKLGPNPQKDVFVTFGKLPVDRAEKLEVTVNTIKSFPLASMKIRATIKNTGPVAVYGTNTQVFFDGKMQFSKNFKQIVPYSEEQIDISISVTPFGNKIPDTVTVIANSQKVDVPTFKTTVIITQLSVLLLFAFIVAIFAYLKVKGGQIINFYNAINKIKQKFSKKSS